MTSSSSSSLRSYRVPSAKNVRYYAISQDTPAGTFYKMKADDKPPKIFEQLQIKGLTLPNRIGVSPMCMYSADEKYQATPYHLATAVSPDGPLSPHDLGIWNEAQARKLKEQLIGIQIAHGGRKASGQPPFVHLEEIADESVGGFPTKVVTPSPLEFRSSGNYRKPNELDVNGIKRIINDFGDAAKRAVEVSGFDFVEIHGAHGYLIHEFYSSVSNKRLDDYGGSLENRIRFLLEVIDNNASDNITDEDGWSIEDSIKLANIVVGRGVDVIDVSSGGNSYKQRSRSMLYDRGKPFHEPFAKAIKKSIGNKGLVACVANLERDAKETSQLIEEGSFDITLMGKGFLKNPGLVWRFADDLNIRTHQAGQYDWVYHPKKEGIYELIKRTSAMKL
ncbi:NADH:flavin oxidoreductase/12-oxophytodienoate reductase [Scheffersomyces xylosifermentans]|uniref:NADH:flavin oxidoreductase/12-oxophytodienoate reductase n=1 Tax=Scheffersomyces xylosifermentans TaxID=1304137 RepID=UPI00315CDF80